MKERFIKIYDTTLRDGAQTPGLTLTTGNKLKIAQKLADLGFHYIEGGWPGANPTDLPGCPEAGLWGEICVPGGGLR